MAVKTEGEMDSDMALAQEKEDSFQLTGAKRTLMTPQISKGEKDLGKLRYNVNSLCWSSRLRSPQ